jgi:riboflavin biosynthesis pyrimidine reductase
MAGPDAPLEPLEVLFERPGLPSVALPAVLARLYGGSIGWDGPTVFANFVGTIDGIVAIPSMPGSNRLIAGESLADRFVMGLLRACADAVVIGSGTMAAALGKPPAPEVVVLTQTGLVNPGHPAFAAGGIAVTTDGGAGQLGGLAAEQVVSLGAEVSAVAVVEALRARGHSWILSEGGPHAIAPFFEAGLVEELFLTVSPLLAGRGGGSRLSLVEGLDLVPAGPPRAELLGVRRDGDHLFLRYRF